MTSVLQRVMRSSCLGMARANRLVGGAFAALSLIAVLGGSASVHAQATNDSDQSSVSSSNESADQERGTSDHDADDHDADDHDHEEFIQLPEPLELDLFSGWLDEWNHADYSRSGTPYVHAFGIEPAFLCRDILVNGEFSNGEEGKEYEVEAELEFALTRRIGLVVEGGYSWLNPRDGSSERGFGDIGVAPRFLMIEYDNFLMSVSTGFEFPTGNEDRGLGAGETIFVPSASSWLDLGNNITLQNVVGVEHGLSSNENVLFWGGALIWSLYTDGSPVLYGPDGGVRTHFPQGMLNIIAELRGELPVNGEEQGNGTAEWQFGLSYAITPQLEIRGAISFPAWNPREFDNGATVGLIYHF